VQPDPPPAGGSERTWRTRPRLTVIGPGMPGAGRAWVPGRGRPRTTLISGQRLDGPEVLRLRTPRRTRAAGRDATDHPQSGRADVDHDVTVDLNLSEPNTSALQRSRGLVGRSRACPLHARQEESPRTVTVSNGQRISRPAGQPIRR
jgi:hypothetical protein